MCEAVCTLPNMTARCAGFTYYPPGSRPAGPRGECCFRTSTVNKPLDPASRAECYEKHGGGNSTPPHPETEECTGAPVGVMVVGPSLSYVRSKQPTPLTTENLLENTARVLRFPRGRWVGSEHPISVLSRGVAACYLLFMC